MCCGAGRYGPIKDTELRVAVAMADQDLNVEEISSTFTSSTAAAASKYHRIDLVRRFALARMLCDVMLSPEDL